MLIYQNVLVVKSTVRSGTCMLVLARVRCLITTQITFFCLVNYKNILKELSHGIFVLFWPHTKLLLNGRKLENNSLIR